MRPNWRGSLPALSFALLIVFYGWQLWIISTHPKHQTNRAYPVNTRTHHIQILGCRPIRFTPKMGGHILGAKRIMLRDVDVLDHANPPNLQQCEDLARRWPPLCERKILVRLPQRVTLNFNRWFYSFNAFRSLLGLVGDATAPTYAELYSGDWQHPRCSGCGF